MVFVFFRLCYREYGAIELLSLADYILREMNSIKNRGYISENALDKTFMVQIKDHLYKLVYKNKLLGNS